MKASILNIILVFACFIIHGQTIHDKGVPIIDNYNPSDYLNKGKVWDIESAPNGIIYMAADEGLIEYDGKKWKAFEGSTGNTRSIKVINDSVIYSGSDMDFGIWKRDKTRNFIYNSLFNYQNESKKINEEFWNVIEINGDLHFISFNNIYIFKNGQITKIPAPTKFTGSYLFENTIYLSDENAGILFLKDLNLKTAATYRDAESITLSGIFRESDELIFVSRNTGLFRIENNQLIPFVNELSEKLTKSKAFSFTQAPDGMLFYGSVLQGVFASNTKGNLIHWINKKKGLSNNTILSLHYAKDGKLWLGMDNGIACIHLLNPSRYVIDYSGDFGTGYTALLDNKLFYLGTNQGLYKINWDNLSNNSDIFNFQIQKGTEGQVWNICKIDDELFICHDKGLFILSNNALNKALNIKGFWTVQKLNENYYLSGNYDGLYLLRKNESKISVVKKVEDIFGSCTQIIHESENVYWINIPNYGVIRTWFDAAYKPLKRDIYPETLFKGKEIHIKNEDKKIVIITSISKYLFNSISNRFDEFTDDAVSSYRNDAIYGFQHTTPLNKDFSFFPVHNGFGLINHSIQGKSMHQLIERNLKVFNNEEEIIFPSDSLIPYSFNNITVEWIVPHCKDAKYQFKLNSQKEWTKLSPNNAFTLLNLKPGKHTITARAIIEGNLTEEKQITILVDTPFLRSSLAYLIYFILLILIIAIIYRRQKNALNKQRADLLIKEEEALRKQQEKHKLEVITLEQEMLQNEFEQLKLQLKNKTIELANKAKDNDEKRNLLEILKDKIDTLQKEPASAKQRLAEIKRLLENHLGKEDHTFEIQMDELHQEFFRKLKEQFPSLSLHDLRLCAYIKIGLNSKEIAEIMHILPSSVFVSRSRLRKKLNISAEEDILLFFNKLMSEENK